MPILYFLIVLDIVRIYSKPTSLVFNNVMVRYIASKSRFYSS
jgi:hypothetical protein